MTPEQLAAIQAGSHDVGAGGAFRRGPGSVGATQMLAQGGPALIGNLTIKLLAALIGPLGKVIGRIAPPASGAFAALKVPKVDKAAG